MELVFIDETGDHKFKDYFGLCAAVINSAHYRKAKAGLQDALRRSKWDEDIEFKGSHIFSSKKGDPDVSIDERIDLAKSILDLNKSNANARMRFHFASNRAVADTKAAYLELLPSLLERALPKAKRGQGKDLVVVSCDHRDDISATEIQAAILPVLQAKGYTLVEEVTTPSSGFETVGLLYADLVAYLSARIETISNDVELFEEIPPELLEHNAKVKKLKSSTELISRIKKLDRHVLDGRRGKPTTRRSAAGKGGVRVKPARRVRGAAATIVEE